MFAQSEDKKYKEIINLHFCQVSIYFNPSILIFEEEIEKLI